MFQFSSQAVWNYNLENRADCENNDVCCGDDEENCEQYQSYYYGQYGICCQLTAMYISTLVYFLIMTILEAKFTSKWSEKRLVYLNKNLTGSEEENINVLQEYQRILNVYTEEQKRPKEMLEMYNTNANVDFYLVNRVKKMYNLIRVVKGVSFGLNRGDCLGILGNKGSGKTIMFRVLTGMSPVNTGGARIYANDRFYYLYKNYKRYLRFIGFCPQNNTLIEILTGRELLHFFAKIRGVTSDTRLEVTKWINLIGLEDCADNLCRDYSHGNKRKLSIGIALVGAPLIVMLDEPTTGLDPISRKRIWKVIKTVQNQTMKPCIILSSSNVEECEALCNKMVILVNGQFKSLGTMSNIKEEYATGFIIKIKLSIHLMSVLKTSTEDISNNGEPAPDDKAINLLVNDCRQTFVGCITREDKYIGVINYHVKDRTKKWNDIFKEMKELKNKHTIIEDYDISEATLEDAFVTMSESNKSRLI
ncbi:hypothetical protein RN001_000143 [Aquatica leii]|uniref:ABC transporter domain-containing protein n=1 Tax=Aquatica leii TaxID=1421715 RepID=A0AAN7PEG5_9COLE|nr:hypothetical protein RN001_000143 [Aquatica leii]